jgi:hypothetical protein
MGLNERDMQLWDEEQERIQPEWDEKGKLVMAIRKDPKLGVYFVTGTLITLCESCYKSLVRTHLRNGYKVEVEKVVDTEITGIYEGAKQ